MDALLQGLIAAISKTENIAVLVLMAMVVFLAWLNVTARREEREDRTKFIESLDGNTKAITELKITLAGLGGKLS